MLMMKNITKISAKKNIALLWGAQMISAAGDAIYQLALLWIVLDITGSSVLTGLVAMSAHIPAILFGLYSGVLSDRFNRFYLMVFSHASQALTVMIIPIMLFYGIKHIMLIGFLAFIRSSFGTLFPPALNAFIAEKFPKEKLVKINSLLMTSGYLAFLLGPALAGILLGILSLRSLFIFDAVSFLIAILLLLMITIPRSTLKKENSSTTFQDLLSGLGYLRKHPAIGLLIFLTIINNLFIMGPAIVGMPILVKMYLGGTASDFAFIEAGMALGMLLGAFAVYRFSDRLSIGKLLLAGMIWDGVTYSFFYWASTVPVAIILIILHGMGIPTITISRTAIIQRHTPAKYHGRLFSMVHLGVTGMTSLSAGLVGFLNTLIPIQEVFFFFGIGGALCGVIGASIPTLRTIDQQIH